MDLSIIILNWNTRDLLEKCLRSLECPQPAITFEVIVVDNASEDDSRDMVAREFPQFQLVFNKKNLGFGAGNNVAIPQSQGRYVLFLNSDTIVMDGALTALVRFGDAHPDIGVIGPKLLNGDGSLQYSCRRFPNLAAGFFRNTPLGRLFPNNRFASDYLMQDWDHATPRDVDWVSGAALMIRREVLDVIGGFDEEYYMYCEDVDLCRRAGLVPLPSSALLPLIENFSDDQIDLRLNRAMDEPASRPSIDPPLAEKFPGHLRGSVLEDEISAVDERVPTRQSGHWRVVYLPDAQIYHLIGKSSDKAPTRMTYEFHRSQYLFYKKHYRRTTPLLLRPIIPLGIALRAVGTMARYRVRYWQRRLRGQEQRKH